MVAATPPGWYPDPFAAGWLRWWDGATWTAQQTPAQPVRYGTSQPTPEGDLATEEKWARRGVVAFVAMAVLNVAGVLVLAPAVGHYIRHVIDSCDTLADGTVTCPDAPSTGIQLGIQFATLPLIVPQLVMMIWLFQAAKIARNLGFPARRDPGWAFGFFVPIVNLWFPYQVARDTFPPGHPERRTVGRWWAWYLIQGFVVVPTMIVAIFSVPAAVIVGAAGVVPVLLAVKYGMRMVSAVLDEHRRWLHRS